MYDSLIEGKRYKVRLKPKEELLEVVEEDCFHSPWFRDYMDGQVGVLHYDEGESVGSVYKVFWESDTFWHYKSEHLKVLGEVD